jgi:serine/threonine protein kinase
VSTDLFAVGVILYELLCDGHHPYPGSKPMVGKALIDPRTIRPDLSPELAEFLMEACAPYRDERFSTAQEMREALQDVQSKGRAHA